MREAASGAHIYGKQIVAVEAFTTGPPMSGWQPPSYLKSFADYYFAQGMNRVVFHTSDHQPFVDEKHKPGITLAIFGQHYTRNNTWAEPAVAWNTYLSRCSYLLQQGQFVGDLAYYYGEGAPATVPFWKKVRPEPPAGYNHDYVEHRGPAEPHVGEGRAPRAPRRHELPGAGPAGGRGPSDAARAAKDPRPRVGREPPSWRRAP